MIIMAARAIPTNYDCCYRRTRSGFYKSVAAPQRRRQKSHDQSSLRPAPRTPYGRGGFIGTRSPFPPRARAR